MRPLLIVLALALVASAQGPLTEPDAEEVLSETFVYNLNGRDFEGTTLFTLSPEERPLVLFVADPFGSHTEHEFELATKLAAFYTVAILDDLGPVRSHTAFTRILRREPERLVDHLSFALRALGTPDFVEGVAVVGHGAAATLILEATRLGALDVSGVVAISPTALRVSNETRFEVSLPTALYIGANSSVPSNEIFSFEEELRSVNSSYEVTRFASVGEELLADALTRSRTQSLLQTFLRAAFDPGQLEYLAEPFDETRVAEDEIGFDFVEYRERRDALRGFIAYPLRASTDAPLPLVVIAPDWDGVDDYEIWRAKLLAQMGYVAFVADIFGSDIEQGSSLPIPERTNLVSNYFGRPFVGRLSAAVEAAARYDAVIVDAERVAMMVYCFGGSGVLELAAAAIPGLKGVVAFHPGALIPQTTPPPDCQPVAVLVLNGADDSSDSAEDIKAFLDYSSALGTRWEFTNYGVTRHSFTLPTAPRDGVFAAYSPFADVLSFSSMSHFLDALFADATPFPQCATE